MRESHCGALPEAMLDPLVLAQRARDARMAARLEAAGAERGAVLITGNGHARTMRRVPALLAKGAPGKKIVSVGVRGGDRRTTSTPPRYRDDGPRPRPGRLRRLHAGARRDDPCEGTRAHMEKRRAKTPAPPASPAPAPAKLAAPDASPAAEIATAPRSRAPRPSPPH